MVTTWKETKARYWWDFPSGIPRCNIYFGCVRRSWVELSQVWGRYQGGGRMSYILFIIGSHRKRASNGVCWQHSITHWTEKQWQVLHVRQDRGSWVWWERLPYTEMRLIHLRLTDWLLQCWWAKEPKDVFPNHHLDSYPISPSASFCLSKLRSLQLSQSFSFWVCMVCTVYVKCDTAVLHGTERVCLPELQSS